MKPGTRTEVMERLGFFIGTWTVEVTHPHLQPNPIVGETKFEWMDEMYIIQRTHIDKAEFPSSTVIYDWDSASGNYVQHYFDTRGVTRLYQMSFEGGIWNLWRDVADFSPLDFFQRFTGEIGESGNVIESVWEQSEEGIEWKHDFKLLFKRKERAL
ncbi:hypothetical protein [uncultured Planococcus sp.]|uniref:hypothetical protein n=1 Tax=uncultured Planococcus sp. TaxID=337815 RepID=UPI002636AEB1|nr:hypothetical protein [uncultured Planococcus sp.]